MRVTSFAAFFSIDAQKIRAYWRTLIPSEYTSDVDVLVERIDRSLAGVVRGQVTICIHLDCLNTLIGAQDFRDHGFWSTQVVVRIDHLHVNAVLLTIVSRISVADAPCRHKPTGIT